MGVPPRLTGRVVTTTAAWWGEPLRPLTSEAPTSPKHQQALRPALPPAATERVHRERQRSTWWPWAQRHPGVEREARVAAGEHQAQQVISHHRFGRILAFANSAMAGASLSVRRASFRIRSTAHRRAVTITQARGLSGIPMESHVLSALTMASCRASSASVMSPVRRISVASILVESSRVRALSRSAVERRIHDPVG